MLQIAEIANQSGLEATTFSTICFKKPIEQKKTIKTHQYFGSYFENKMHAILAKITGLNGYFSFWGTRMLIKQLDVFSPDIVHLHNLHQFCVNIPMLIRYFTKQKIPVVRTLHDCWLFTGNCPHFMIVDCQK